MDIFLLVHTIFQLILAIPLIYIFIKWRKISIILKILIILTFLYSLPFYWDTLLHKPIKYDVDLSQSLAGKEYTFDIYPLKRDYVIGFQIESSRSSCYWSWPEEGTNDTELVLENVIYPKFFVNREYVKFNCLESRDGSQFLHGRIVEFQNLFKKTKIIYKIKTQPTQEIKSLVLTMDLMGYDDKIAVFFPLRLMYHFIVVYGSIGIYFLLKLVITKFRLKKQKR